MRTGGRWSIREAGALLAMLAPVVLVATSRVLIADIESDAAAAIFTLRDIASAQALIQRAGRIDTDRDGIGEFATLQELAGSAGPRRGFRAAEKGAGASSDFSESGAPLAPPVLGRSLSRVDAEGVARKRGIGFRVFLPDSSSPAGFVHETGPAPSVGLSGGSGRIGVDASEKAWCAYAFSADPPDFGGTRFFVNQEGIVLYSPPVGKTALGAVGRDHPAAAFTGDGIASPAAVGTLGRDGSRWLGEGDSLSFNEARAIEDLRRIASAQAAFQSLGAADVDGDGIGEYGTLMELSGTVGLRMAPDFSTLGKVLSPALLPVDFGTTDAAGFLVRNGYAFMLFLPSESSPAGFVHETGPRVAPGVTGRIGIDLAETTWCAYAQPLARGFTGNRRFFVNQAGDVMQSANEVARAQGVAVTVIGNSAFTCNGITGQVAVGTCGMDGDVWKVAW